MIKEKKSYIIYIHIFFFKKNKLDFSLNLGGKKKFGD